jgi:UrcA family protein
MRRSKAFCVVTVLALTVGGVCAPASAQDAGARMVRVRHSDLNLASVSGQKALNYRVAAAVRSICDNRGARDLAMQVQSAKCRLSTTADAATKVATLLAGPQQMASASEIQLAAVR